MDQPALEDLLAECWRLLAAAPAARDMLFRTPVLASVGADGAPDARTVVLRAVDGPSRALTVFTDSRSAKAGQLAADPRVSLVFHDPARGLQLRAWGDAAVHGGDAVARARWDGAPAATRIPYLCVPGPGRPIGRAHSGLPDPLPDDPDAGYANFLAVVVTVRRLEWLRLASTGNLSARFDWDGAGRLSATWIVP